MKTSNKLNISNRELEELKLVSKDYESDYNKVLKGYPILKSRTPTTNINAENNDIAKRTYGTFCIMIMFNTI